MTTTSKAGFPTDGGADEKLDYLASQITTISIKSTQIASGKQIFTGFSDHAMDRPSRDTDQ